MKVPVPNQPLPVLNPQGTDADMLRNLQRVTFEYFRNEVNPQTGLIADRTQPGAASSIAAVGLGISAYVVAVERAFLSRADAIERTLTILRFFHSSRQGPEADATGYKGFYYHFLDMQTGRRAWQSELSTIDTAILIAGVLTARGYFTRDSKEELEIRELADRLYRRVDWKWALNHGATICHGWKPESGFLAYRWDRGYSEAIILYTLAIGSPTFAVDPASYRAWTSTFEWRKIYDVEQLYAGPLFIHQMSHLWLDFRGIHDEFNRKTGIDYFENSRRATHAQRQYGIENPLGFAQYGEHSWGFTASAGPGPATLEVNGVQRTFYDYIARGAPFGPDDGTIAPWAVVASLPFAPEIVIDTIRHAIECLNLSDDRRYGCEASFNPTYPERGRNPLGWVAPWRVGLNQGPIVLMIENFYSDFIWKIIRGCPYIVDGLRRAGFRDGWLDS